MGFSKEVIDAYQRRLSDKAKTNCLAEHLAATHDVRGQPIRDHYYEWYEYLRPVPSLEPIPPSEPEVQVPKVTQKRKRDEVEEPPSQPTQGSVPPFAQKRDREVAFALTFSQKRQRDVPGGHDIGKEKKRMKEIRVYQQKRRGTPSSSSSYSLDRFVPPPKRISLAPH